MEIFSELLVFRAGNSPVTGEFPTPSQWRGAFFFFFFDLRLNKRLSKQSWGWWSQTPSRSLWRHCNDIYHKSLKPCEQFFWMTCVYRADFRFGPSQWETSLQSNPVSHWLGAILESILIHVRIWYSSHLGGSTWLQCQGHTLPTLLPHKGSHNALHRTRDHTRCGYSLSGCQR